MAEKHTSNFDYFDLIVEVTDDGDVKVALAFPEAADDISMDFDTFREMMDFVGIHGLAMKEPYFVEYAATVEGAEDRAEAARA